jgi:hypothetical protein
MRMINYKYVYTIQIRQCFFIFDSNTTNVFFKELHPYQSSTAIPDYNKEKRGEMKTDHSSSRSEADFIPNSQTLYCL